MTIAGYANMLGVNYTECGCYDKLREQIAIREKTEYYVYRNGYEILNDGKIRQPSVYIFDKYFKKIKGNGHYEFGARTYDYEYQIFLNKDDALEYATYKQKEFMLRKERERDQIKDNELNSLTVLAKKYNIH